jgi:hypothetical protein
MGWGWGRIETFGTIGIIGIKMGICTIKASPMRNRERVFAFQRRESCCILTRQSCCIGCICWCIYIPQYSTDIWYYMDLVCENRESIQLMCYHHPFPQQYHILWLLGHILHFQAHSLKLRKAGGEGKTSSLWILLAFLGSSQLSQENWGTNAPTQVDMFSSIIHSIELVGFVMLTQSQTLILGISLSTRVPLNSKPTDVHPYSSFWQLICAFVGCKLQEVELQKLLGYTSLWSLW